MNVYLMTLLLAAGAGLGATAVLQLLSDRGRLAGPWGRHAVHRPKLGGIAVFLAFAVTPFVASALSSEASEYFSPKSRTFLGFLGAGALVFATGLFDDWRVASWWQKLAGQIPAAAAVYAAGYRIEQFALPWGGDVELSLAAPIVTVLWILFFTNAINLIDGKDGVAVGVTVLAAATLAQVGADAHHPAVALLLVVLAGVGLGYLPFNLPPASSELGDSGALLLGFLLGTLSIRGSTGVTDSVFIAVPIVALGLPIVDTLLAAMRRALDRSHPFLGDTDHIHDRLEREAGLGPRGILAVIYGASALFAGGALILHYVDQFVVEVAVFVGMSVLVGLILTRLGYAVSLWNSQTGVWLRRRASLRAQTAGAETDLSASADHEAGD